MTVWTRPTTASTTSSSRGAGPAANTRSRSGRSGSGPSSPTCRGPRSPACLVERAPSRLPTRRRFRGPRVAGGVSAQDGARSPTPSRPGQGPRRRPAPVSDQRHVVDDVPQPAGPVPRRGLGDHVRRAPAGHRNGCSTPWTGGWRASFRSRLDRVQHCLAKYVSPDGPDFDTLSRGAASPDRVRRGVPPGSTRGWGGLGRRTGPDDLVVFMSDHGFQTCTGAVHMDRLLEHLGYPRVLGVEGHLRADAMGAGPGLVARKAYDALGLHGRIPLPQSVNWAKTKAYTSVRSTGEGVSINLAGRDIDGIVDPGDYDKVRDELMDRLGSYVDPKTGKTSGEVDRQARGRLPGREVRRASARHHDGAERGVLASSRTRRARSRTPTG